MTPVHSLVNQYRGINAHLNSQLQARNWNSFHSMSISFLTAALRASLRPLGYIADLEQSVQIKHSGGSSGPKSDAAIFGPDPTRATLPPMRAAGDAGALVLPVPDMLAWVDAEPDYYNAIAICERKADTRGRLIAWLELLSPSNKPRGQDFATYRTKRESRVLSDLVYVEIDYLHQQPPTFDLLPDYSAGEPDSHPYRITVIDPRPTFREGEARLYPFAVDAPIPTVTLPLSGDDRIDFDFGLPYQRTFAEMFLGDEVDYAQLPPRFDSYRPDDQARIANRMIAVIEAARAGQSLDGAPLPTPDCRSMRRWHGSTWNVVDPCQPTQGCCLVIVRVPAYTVTRWQAAQCPGVISTSGGSGSR